MPFGEPCTVSSSPFFTEFVGLVPCRLPLTNTTIISIEYIQLDKKSEYANTVRVKPRKYLLTNMVTTYSSRTKFYPKHSVTINRTKRQQYLWTDRD